MNLVNALLMLFFLNGCASNSNVRNIPLVYDSFVKVDVKSVANTLLSKSKNQNIRMHNTRVSICWIWCYCKKRFKPLLHFNCWAYLRAQLKHNSATYKS